MHTDAEAAATKPLAFNQGFYNLSLAGMHSGHGLLLAGSPAAGATLFFAGTGSMVAAGLVLFSPSPGLARAAFALLTAPGLGIFFGIFVLTP